MKATKKTVAALLSVTTNEILINLVTDILLVEEENKWKMPVVQELLEGTRKFYEPEDIKVDVVTRLLKSDAIKDTVLLDDSVKVSKVFNTTNEIIIDYETKDANWIKNYIISIDDYLKAAKDNA